jgi:hypothetical protein
MASSFLRFLDHTKRRTTRDLYLTTHNTHNRQTSMPPVGFEPTISAGKRPQTYPLDRAATGTGVRLTLCYIKSLNAELSPPCHLLVLLGAHQILHISRVRVKASERGSAVTKKPKHPALAGRYGCFRVIT